MRDLHLDTIAKACDGDQEAMREVLETCERPVYNIAMRFISNPHDAQDAAQDAMIKIYKNLSTFKGNSAFSSWVYRLTFNACMDFLRRQSRMPKTTSDDEAILNISDDGTRIDELFDQAYDADIVRSAIGQLEEHHRQAIILCDYKGLSYAEIAEIMGTSIGTVKSRINRARNSLKNLLKDMELF